MLIRFVILTLFCAATGLAQLTTDQRQADFRNLWDLYARRYAAIDWKKAAVQFDVLELKSWTDRINNTKTDLDFYDLMIEYVSRLQDAHDQYSLPSNFEAHLGFGVDIYDGKLLIDRLDRKLLPARRYPFEIGDQLLSVDGRSAEDWLTLLSKYVSGGNPRTVRRLAAELITDRYQSEYPYAPNISAAAEVVVLRQSGVTETYTILWQQLGLAASTLGPSPAPHAKAAPALRLPAYRQFLLDKHAYKLPGRINVVGFGDINPVFKLPKGFVQRLGNDTFDSYYTATYATPEGVRIGFLRIPDFEFADFEALDPEIAFFQANTDVLVVDVMRNPGGNVCDAEDTVSRLTSNAFNGTVAEFRIDWSDLLSVDSAFLDAAQFGADDDTLAQLSLYKREFNRAFATENGRTGALPLCASTASRVPAKVTYSKPLLLLTDEMSASSADIFAAMLQDNHVGTLFGFRTMGAGGSPEFDTAGVYTEGSTTVTRTLVVRPIPMTFDGYPATSYIENAGVRPDVNFDYMTTSNLLANGADFVSAFTAAAVKLAATSK